jgi:O-antigen/teichoic acid export membrane protein
VLGTLSARLLLAAISVLTGVVVARRLGSAGLGVYAVINLIILYATQFGSFGMPLANTYEISQDKQSLAPIAANSLLFSLVVGSVLAAFTVLLSFVSPHLVGDIPMQLIGFAALSIPFQLMTLLGLNIFVACGLIKHFNWLEIVSQSTVLINAVLIVLVFNAGLTTLIALNSLASVAIATLIMTLIIRRIRKSEAAASWRIETALFRRMLPYGFKAHLHTVASLLLLRVDLLLVKYFRGAAQAGVYSVASQVGLMLFVLPGVISILVFPRIASRKSAEQSDVACAITRHTTLVMFVLCLAAVPAVFVLPLLYGPQFSDVTIQALILLPGVFLISIAAVLSQYFSGIGLPIALPLFWLAALGVNITLNVFFIPAFGPRGAAVASSTSYTLLFLLITIYFCSRTGHGPIELLVIKKSELAQLLDFRSFRASSS